MNIGIIQSHGLGDIIIALPIAKWFSDNGHNVFWPIPKQFYPSFAESAPYINFTPLSSEIIDHSSVSFMYGEPLDILEHLGCDRIIPLYSSFAADVPGAVIDPDLGTKLPFDEYKYAVTNVPFEQKWKLRTAIHRNMDRETDLYNKVVHSDKYICCHLDGSDGFHFALDTSTIPNDHQIVTITPLTNNIFDWLSIMEGAALVVTIDSCYANMAEQLEIRPPKVFIHRSSPLLTPTLRTQWGILA